MPLIPIKQKYIWQQALSDLITDPKELLGLLALDVGSIDAPSSLLNAAIAASRIFPLKVTRGFVARMQKNNINDPLLKQVLPLGIELINEPGFGMDPLQENKIKTNPVPGLLHKYRGRVLVTLSSACAIHCRYCFRRHFPYQENNPGTHGWVHIFNYIKADISITEVILSGGDPLSVNDKLLKLFTDQLAEISHVKRLRIHTRLPIVLPERITDEFIDWIKSLSIKPVIVIHANHANEINDDVKAALLKLREAGIALLNQSVLLKGVNDDVNILANLSELLFANGVLPYYLHVLDKVKGAGHFDLPIEKINDLYATLIHMLPGYLVPKLVREEAGKLSKTVIAPHLTFQYAHQESTIDP